MAFTRCLCITLLQHINFLTLSIEWLRILFFHLRDDVWGENHQYNLYNLTWGNKPLFEKVLKPESNQVLQFNTDFHFKSHVMKLLPAAPLFILLGLNGKTKKQNMCLLCPLVLHLYCKSLDVLVHERRGVDFFCVLSRRQNIENWKRKVSGAFRNHLFPLIFISLSWSFKGWRRLNSTPNPISDRICVCSPNWLSSNAKGLWF